MENQSSRPPATYPPARSLRSRRGITMPELMVVIGIIVVLMAILLPALRSVRMQTLTATSMSNMRQIATFMSAYERDNRETILPSQFDYSDNSVFTFQGKVRSGTPTTGDPHVGSWADILWTENGLGSFAGAKPYDAPDKMFYVRSGLSFSNPLRSAVANTRDSRGDGVARPHGTGAHEIGLPGFFAANDFFNASPDAPAYLGVDTPETGRWWATGQIRAPERSMYLVDSFFGEVIEPVAESFDNTPDDSGVRSIEVDFRYSGAALMLMLDGSIRPEGSWQVLEDLEEQRSIRIRQLDRRFVEP